jgi:hypothetical protein
MLWVTTLTWVLGQNLAMQPMKSLSFAALSSLSLRQSYAKTNKFGFLVTSSFFCETSQPAVVRRKV